MSFPREAVSVKGYQRSSDFPLIAQAGSAVTVLRRDPNWPGWLWCKGSSGSEAWTPESWLTITVDQAILKRDYNSIELTFQVGEQLTLLLEESGWYWASNPYGEFGWVPADHVQIKLYS